MTRRCMSALSLIFSPSTFSPLAGFSDPSSAGCKQFTVGFAAVDDSSSTATAEIAVNGMDPPELGFPPAEPTKGTSGQWKSGCPECKNTARRNT